MNRLAIRWRLTIAFTGFVLLLMAGLSLIILYQVHHHLLNSADLSLSEESLELIEELDRSQDRDTFMRELGNRYDSHQHYYFQVLDDRLNCVFQSRFLTNLQLPDPGSRPSEIRGKQYQDFAVEGVGHFRVLDVAVRDEAGNPLLVRTVSSRDALDSDFRSYIGIFVAVIPVGLITAIAMGYVVAGRMLSPVKELVHTAQKISAKDIDQRLPVINQHDELGELSLTLNSTFDRLSKAMEAIRNFTSDAAHELRSPLAVLRTEAEIALRRDRSVDELRSVVMTTLEEARRLSDIVEQLLALGRHDAGIQPMLSDEVPITAVLDDVLARLRPVAEAKQIRFESTAFPSVSVQGNDVWLSQLFSNLLDNAIKFTPTGGCVQVRAEVVNEWLSVEIRDTGVGLSREDSDQVFERFFRADRSREHHKGSGLGLAICKSIVESHGGNISVSSQLGVGSVFVVKFPVSAVDDSKCLEGAKG